MAIFATEERLTFNDIQRHHGPVLKLVDIAENYIKNNIHWRVEFTGELQRKEIPEIPIDAIREALLNSFCHKDYASGESNEVAIYRDRIEIYNPGSFPEGLEPQDYIDRVERPIRRNPKIARILYYSKDIESFGTGLKRIADACRNAGVRYEFQKKKTGFVVCFYRSSVTKEEQVDRLEDVFEKKMSEIQNEAILRIMQYLNGNSEITTKIGSEITGKSIAQVRRYLKILCDIGVIEKTKSTKGNIYKKQQR